MNSDQLMNCDGFQQRMQQLIDEGVCLDADHQLAMHARECKECDQQMRIWNQIDSVLPLDASPQTTELRSRRLAVTSVTCAAAIAATLLIAFVNRPQPDRTLESPVALRSLQPDPKPAADVDPADWWRNVQGQDWIGQTMPAVHSVRDGVAPLGRSFLQAVAILTTSRGETTS